jgi:Conjugal transfer protein
VLRIFLLAGVGVVEIVALAGCTTDSSVPTTPTFSAARYVPAPGGVLAGPAPEPRTVAPATVDPSLTGSSAIAAANRESTVEPDAPSLHGATWYIEDAHPDLIYRVCTQPQHVSTILLPPGERFNGAVGGNVDAFLINVSYAGPRPAVSILPRMAGAGGNLQLVTTAGFYSFRLASCREALNLADVSRRNEPAAAASALPQPEGDFTRLALVREDGPLPAWAPAEAWADSRKMTLRFDDPLPVLPTLFAGRRGEQIVNYRTVRGQGSTFLVTDRRVTEAELRLGSEKVRITVDPDAVKAGTAADPAQGGDAWKPAAGAVEPDPLVPRVPAGTPKQPMAVNPVLGVPSAPAAVRL